MHIMGTQEASICTWEKVHGRNPPPKKKKKKKKAGAAYNFAAFVNKMNIG